MVPLSKCLQDPITSHHLHCHRSSPSHHVLLSGLWHYPSWSPALALAPLNSLSVQPFKNDHLKIVSHLLKTLGLLRGKVEDFTMMYKVLHDLALAAFPNTIPFPYSFRPRWFPFCSFLYHRRASVLGPLPLLLPLPGSLLPKYSRGSLPHFFLVFPQIL